MTTLRIHDRAIAGFLRSTYASADVTSWREQLLDASLRLVGGARGALLMNGTTEWTGPTELRLTTMDPGTVRGESVHWQHEAVFEQYRALPDFIFERMFGRTHGNLATAASGLSSAQMTSVPAWGASWGPDIRDAVGLVLREPDGRIANLTIGLTEEPTANRRVQALLHRLAAHFAAGVRLATAKKPSSIDEAAEAVLDPAGKVLHATPNVVNRRAALHDGYRRRAHALGTKVSAEEALEVWQGLVAGRWSLVDFFDTDGKRLILAVKNAPRVDRRDDLTPRERRVAALAAMGHRDKEIAYMLGLSLAAVSTSLRRARVKLGVKTRTELATSWRGREQK